MPVERYISQGGTLSRALSADESRSVSDNLVNDSLTWFSGSHCATSHTPDHRPPLSHCATPLILDHISVTVPHPSSLATSQDVD